MIRPFEETDMPKVLELLVVNNLPQECLPDLNVKIDGEEKPNPLYVVKRVLENGESRIAMICFLKVRSELYFFIDHTVGTPEQRWQWLREFTEDMKLRAWELGFDQMTAFVPPEIDESFSKRLKDLGFIRSAYVPYSLNLL